MSTLGSEISLSIQIRVNNRILNANETNTIELANQTNILKDLKCSLYRQKREDDDDEKNDDDAKKYLTIIGQTISIVCLVALLAMYFTHKALRNLPGLVLICLSIALIASQACFLISLYVTRSFVARNPPLDDTCNLADFGTSNLLFKYFTRNQPL